ncbi:hypothetical protein SmJEL517_g01203 [Synchytrium microbalum]|uniref:AMP-dependent synthetase/ligase domain-containing protein n=1 Tax=Synchytrium microbalum TaxID=1806994 RepID=A0A507C6N8_9FUNG|nr:uncharacterized protein SmJEL517_g01203 [Synchytrium microbalum]TPX36707.1 hypothetical protein SmJEL517_g01203 [Synchytrium microbalum]
MERKVLWTPAPSNASTELSKFQAFVEKEHSVHFQSYQELYQWSTDNTTQFWKACWDYCRIIHSQPPSEILDATKTMDQVPEWFKGARLNFAENMLKYRDDHVAIISTGEQLTPYSLTYAELYDKVEKVARSLRRSGVLVGDRVAAYLPNTEHAIICMLAASGVGAVFSSASPDFGVQGTLDRLGQIQPKLLFCVESVYEDGKLQSEVGKLVDIVNGLPSLEKVVFCGDVGDDALRVPKSMSMDSFILLSADDTTPFNFEQLPFDHPLVIMFTSGSTGKPKCLIHRAGGLLLQHRKEHLIHTSMSRKDVFLYYTTTGWMMWNWQVSALAEGSTLVLFSGKPFLPTPGVLFKVVEDHKITKLGISAKYIQSIRDAGLTPAKSYDLSSLDTIYSTGSPLSSEGFDYIYEFISPNVMVSSITGGTDICSLFGAPNTNIPVIRGQVQCRGLGMSVDVWDDEGKSIVDFPGELVCTRPMPCMPIGFLNDSDGSKYRAAYFYNPRFPNVWFHGDYVQLDSVYGGLVMLGRSDGTLNPRGIRFGSADLYTIVEDFVEVMDSLAVGHKASNNDEVVVLFLKINPNFTFSQELVTHIKERISSQLSSAHVPAIIMPIADIPYTLSGKKTEVVVKRLLAGTPPATTSALRNPESITHFLNLDLDTPITSTSSKLANDNIAIAISEMAAAAINQPALSGLDFSFAEAGFDSLTVLRVKTFLSEKYQYLIDAHALLLFGTRPSTLSRDIRDAAFRKNDPVTTDVTVSNEKAGSKGQTGSYELSLAVQRLAGAWVGAALFHLPIVPGILRRRISFELNTLFLGTVALTREGEAVDGDRLRKATTKLAQLHPALRTRVDFLGSKYAKNILEPIARVLMPIQTTAVLNNPEDSFNLIKASEKAIHDIAAIQKLAAPTFAGSKRMGVVIWNETSSFVVLGLNHISFDMETREIYIRHLKMLYQDPDRKDIYPSKLMDWSFVWAAARSHFEPLPSRFPITRVSSKSLITTKIDYSILSVRIPQGVAGVDLMASLLVLMLQIIWPITNNKNERSVGYLSCINVAKEGYSGNGLIETYSIVQIPETRTLQALLAAFKSRKTYLLTDHVAHPHRYTGHVFMNMRIRSHSEPDTSLKSLNRKKTWPIVAGSMFVHFDVWPGSDRLTAQLLLTHDLKKGVCETLGSRCQQTLREWGLKSEIIMTGELPVLG